MWSLEDWNYIEKILGKRSTDIDRKDQDIKRIPVAASPIFVPFRDQL